MSQDQKGKSGTGEEETTKVPQEDQLLGNQQYHRNLANPTSAHIPTADNGLA